MRVLISGGGTGGHIYPALSLAQGLSKAVPNCQIRFVGAQGGMEEKIIPAFGYQLDTIKITGIDRSSPRRAAASILKIPGALRTAQHLVKQIKPDVVVGTGGYASFPVLYSATRQNLNTAIHEQNAFPGVVNRFLSSRVDLVMLTFAEAGDRLKAKRLVTTGLPVREAVLKAGEMKTNAHEPTKAGLTLLAFGGSLGAQVINQAIWGLLPNIPSDWKVIWVTGQSSYQAWQELLAKKPDIAAQVDIYPYLEQIEQAMSVSDIAICRAGASTLAELTIMGLPAILVPYPQAAENHQEVNARALEAAGGARVILNRDLNSSRLREEIDAINMSINTMASAMRAHAAPHARDLMVKLVLELSKHHH